VLVALQTLWMLIFGVVMHKARPDPVPCALTIYIFDWTSQKQRLSQLYRDHARLYGTSIRRIRSIDKCLSIGKYREPARSKALTRTRDDLYWHIG
jgi:hypothetical protein